MASRHNLANAHRAAGRTPEAVALYERAFADRERVLGPDHPHTLASRRKLAAAYLDAGRAEDDKADLTETGVPTGSGYSRAGDGGVLL